MMDSHKGKAVRSAGAKPIFLPNYSTDLNPIEQVFAKLKHLLHKAAARTLDAVCEARPYTPDDCKNYFRHAGYEPT